MYTKGDASYSPYLRAFIFPHFNYDSNSNPCDKWIVLNPEQAQQLIEDLQELMKQYPKAKENIMKNFLKRIFKEEKKKEPMCNTHNKRLAPFGMAYFVPRWRGENLEWYDKYMDRLNVNRFSRHELEGMNYGTMAIRHFEYDTYCQDIPFTYES